MNQQEIEECPPNLCRLVTGAGSQQCQDLTISAPLYHEVMNPSTSLDSM